MPIPRLLFGGALLATLALSSESEACGGLFCGRTPVDQTAERILFEVADDSVRMTTQISFNGDAADFAWVLPLPEVPDPDSLGVFSQRALAVLDSRSGPIFYDDCSQDVAQGQGTASGGAVGDVTVHIRAEVDAYDVSVVESSDPTALSRWLRDNGYRVTPAMQPYLDLYTAEGMKFLALKLREAAEVSDLKPFSFTLPGTAPSIPLRMTSLAAEPEMSIVVWVLGDQRYEAKNWMNVEVDPSDLRFFAGAGPPKINWGRLVAQEVDEAGGQGWVTEFAGSTDIFVEPLENQIASGNFTDPDDEPAARALLEVLKPHPYITRFYSRVSAEEMASDPVFGRSAGGEVTGVYRLSTPDQCSARESTDPCEFTTCGAGGLCRTVGIDDGSGSLTSVAGCACVPGATARTTVAPDGSASVICQDLRMSFLNPGDQEAGGETLPDPCATFDCGEHGSCRAVNMTPTCVCDQGYVAIGAIADTGRRDTTCVLPDQAVEAAFYERTLPPPSLLPPPSPLPPASGGEAGGEDAPKVTAPHKDRPASCSMPAQPSSSLPFGWCLVGSASVWGALLRRRYSRKLKAVA